MFENLISLFMIMKIHTRNIFGVILFFLCSISNAQLINLEWAYTYGNLDDYFTSEIKIDNEGNLITIGSFRGVVDFDPSPSNYILTSTNNTRDVFIVKTAQNGELIWAKSISGIGTDMAKSMAIDSVGNIYCIGDYTNIADFDPSSDTYTMTPTSSGTFDSFILKLSKDGEFIWAKSFGGYGDEFAMDIILVGSDKLCLTGSFEFTADFDPGSNIENLTPSGSSDCFITMLDSSGNYIWAKKIGGNSSTPLYGDLGRSLTIDINNNLYITGQYYGQVNFDPNVSDFTLTSNGMCDIFILKLDIHGNFIWVKSIGSIGDDTGNSIVVDSIGNLYCGGHFGLTVDFDPSINVFEKTSFSGINDGFLVKLDSNGLFQWVKQIGGTNEEAISQVRIDKHQNIYLTGRFIGFCTFENNTEFDLSSTNNGTNIFIAKVMTDGNFEWTNLIKCNDFITGESIDVGINGEVVVCGNFNDTLIMAPSNNTLYIQPNEIRDFFIAKFSQPKIFGKLFHDLSQDCSINLIENGIPNSYVYINPGNIIAHTNENGYWYVDSLPPGNYIISIDTNNNWQGTCQNSTNLFVSNTNLYVRANDIGLLSTQPCPQPEVTISAPFLRRCFSNQMVYVQACNQNISTGVLNLAYVDVVLDSLLTPTSASIAYTSLGNNKYRFNIGNLNPGQCSNFTINTTVSCNAMLNQTLCMEAQLFPADSCIFDTIPNPTLPSGPGATTCNLPWDHSSLSVDGYCANDTVYFTITNTGSTSNGNMLCYAPVRVYIDGILTYVDSITLSGGQTITYSYTGNGQTWVLQADQHPLHPGNSHPNAHVEACGNLSNWTPNLVNNLPLDDTDPIKDVYCGVVSGAYDPNDKTGFPTGLGAQHEILPNQQIQYQIRFQNTGNDTAFKIVIRDTLDTDLNIFSVVPGVASHTYSFRMYGPRVLEWTFNNIMLPDSNINESLSHGFATFRVDQQPNLSNGTTILNNADIYFDFNDPIITNETVHTVNNQLHNFAVGIKTNVQSTAAGFIVYPNPASEVLTVELLNYESNNIESSIKIESILGQIVFSTKTKLVKNNLDISKLNEGIYILTMENGQKKQTCKIIKY